MNNYLTELLNTNNRVIVPDFGAFIVKHGSKKLVIFNEFLKYNDGLLIEFISKKENIDKEKATEKVNQFVKNVNESLKKDKKYELPGFGALEMNNLNKILFKQDSSLQKPASQTASEPAKDDTAEKSSDKPAQTPEKQTPPPKPEPVSKETAKAPIVKEPEKPAAPSKSETPKEAPKKAPVAEPKKTTDTPKQVFGQKKSDTISHSKTTYQPPKKPRTSEAQKKRKRNTALIIVLANLILIGGFLLIKHFADGAKPTEEKIVIAPENETSAEPDSKETAATTPSADENNNNNDIDQVAGDIANDLEKNNASIKGENLSGPYYIVAGCFANENNADRLVTNLRKKGYAAEKFGLINNLHAVSYESFPDFNIARKALRQIHQAESENAWIYKVDE